ncbi:MAG: DegV family protein [Bacillota bacterium]
MSIRIITDSSCDLPEHLLQKYDIGVAPLHIEIDGEYFKDGVTISHQEFYEKCRQSKNLPKTSQPSPGDVLNLIQESLKEYKHVLSVNLSSVLSGTYQTVNMIRNSLEEKVTTFDTRNGSMGVGLQVLKACELVKKGLSISEIIHKLTEYRDGMDTLVYLETLENAVKGGRVSKVQYIAASMMNIKPVVHIDKEDGYVKVLEKVRGEKKALRYMINRIKEKNIDFSQSVIGITHTDCAERLAEFVKMLKEEINPKEIIISTMGPTIGTYAGLGALYISY